MPMLNAAGAPVATQSQLIQIDLPSEGVASLGTPDLIKVVQAALQLYMAWQTGNPAAILAAIQAFFAALSGG